MPQSRHRHKHRHHHTSNSHTPATAQRARTRRSAVSIMTVFLAVLGVGVAFLSAGSNLVWLLAGAVIGAVAGYFIGRNMDRLAARGK